MSAPGGETMQHTVVLGELEEVRRLKKFAEIRQRFERTSSSDDPRPPRPRPRSAPKPQRPQPPSQPTPPKSAYVPPPQQLSSQIVKLQAIVRGHKQRGELRRMHKKQWRRRMVAKEIVETERTYLSSMRFVCDVVIRSLRSNGILDSKHIDLVFSNFEQICELSAELLKQLDARVGSGVGAMAVGGRGQLVLSDIFLFSAPFLKLYEIYCRNYAHAIEALLRLGSSRSSTGWAVFWKNEVEQHPDFKLRRLEDVLIMPVQRIPRYVLLLRDLLKNTWPAHRDREGLEAALRMLERIADGVNEAMNSSRVCEEMHAAQRHFGAYCAILAPHRRFVMREEVTLLGDESGSTWAGRGESWAWVFSDLLLVAERSGSERSGFSWVYLDHVELDASTFVEVIPGLSLTHALRVSSAYGRTLTLVTADSAMLEMWVECLNGLVVESQIALQLHAPTDLPCVTLQAKLKLPHALTHEWTISAYKRQHYAFDRRRSDATRPSSSPTVAPRSRRYATSGDKRYILRPPAAPPPHPSVAPTPPPPRRSCVCTR